MEICRTPKVWTERLAGFVDYVGKLNPIFPMTLGFINEDKSGHISAQIEISSGGPFELVWMPDTCAFEIHGPKGKI
jgi:hypothetical protein